MSEEEAVESVVAEEEAVEGDEAIEGEESEEVVEGEEVIEDEEAVEGEEVIEGEEKPKSETEKYTLKVYGKEIEVDREQLITLAQKGTAADKNFSEADKQRKELIQVINDLRDPNKALSILEKMGHDTRKLTEDYLLAQMDLESMTDEQKEALSWKQKAETLEAQQKEQLDKTKTKELANRQEELKAEYTREFDKALQIVDIPKTKESIAKMAYYMEVALNEGTELSAVEAAKLVEQDMSSYYSELIEKAGPEQLIKLFGNKIVDKMKNFDLSKIKNPTDNNKVTSKTIGKATKRKSSKKSYRELKGLLDKQFGGDPWEEG